MIVAILLWLFFLQENNPPTVKLISPAAAQSYKWNSQMRYEVSVSDKEDGDTKYNEINTKEVLLEVRALPDTSQIVSFKKERAALQAMMASNCMNCHDFNAKLIGPSFNAISSKYTGNNIDELVKHVRDGSKGIWGDIVMPTHPELTVEETKAMVNWILSKGRDSSVVYAIGNEGSFRMKKPTVPVAGILVTASYLDHQKAAGEQHVFLKSSE